MNNPLVSVIVVAYNSEKYVLETLDSVYNQTYQNIELIVTDDCSTDNTVEICREWIGTHKSRFVRTELITIEKNTGIPANCNRGLNKSHGKWLKYIAGDDILNNNCIEIFECYSHKNSDIQIFFSNIEIIGSERNSERAISLRKWIKNSIKICNSSNNKKQYKYLLSSNFVCAPSAYIKKEILNVLNGFDEEIKFMEDYPFWVKATLSGYTIMALHEILVKYRIENSSVQNSEAYEISFELFKHKYVFKNILYNCIYPHINQYNNTIKNCLYFLLLKFSLCRK